MAKIELKFGAISTDDHVQEAPDTWTARMSKAQWGDRIPRIFELEDGTETWLMNGEPLGGLAVVASLMPDRRTPPKRWEEVPRAAYAPAERLAAMDADHTDVHTFFPNMAGIARGAFIHRGEPEWRLACIRAYNDWLIEAWADVSLRFVPLCIAPMWDAEAAAAEVRRAAALGHRGVIWHGATEALGLPHFNEASWDPLWAACEETELPVCLHVDRAQFRPWEKFAPGVWKAIEDSNSITANVRVLTNLLFSGVLERFPGVKMITVESGLGWIPYLLETLDHEYTVMECWKDGMSRKPSDYFRSNVYANFWYERVGIEMRRHIGVDNIIWETDFPHTTSTYPKSKETREAALADVPEPERRKILVDNAVNLFNLDAA